MRWHKSSRVVDGTNVVDEIITVACHDELKSIRRRFFWGSKDDEKRIFWVKWQQVLKNKKAGGLGVGCLCAKNIGLLGKWK